ncbi:MAG TPA: adenylate/guanylate cyclase domain-containing protein [Burkholderiales bacterium]|nr:adenylate/guanylate cyclase domain-containing protein [Burkholderiales bacterium]
MQTIRQWLDALGLARYAAAFEADDVELDVLPALTEEDLLRLGVSLGHRKRILRALQEVGAAALAPETPQLNAAATSVPPSIESLTAQGERRQVTVLFCDLVGSTALSNTHDPEEYRAILARYHETCIGAIQRFDGFVAQIQGDGIVAYFGYPLAHEGEAERAVRAGLSVVETLAKLDMESEQPLRVRIGIASGLVVVSHILAPDKSAVGETPNLAARLQTVAQPGEVMVGERTRTLAGGSFEYEDRGMHALKGIAEPTRAWKVVGPSGAASRFEAATRGKLTPMVGREQEIALLLDRWELSRVGEGQVVLLQGEPGIGKSRMLRAFRERLGARIEMALQYQCSPYYVNSAFYPIADHLERALKFQREDSPEQKLDKLEARLIGELKRSRTDCSLLARALSIPCEQRYGPLEMSPQRQKDDTIRLLVDIVAAIARDQATVVLFEDVHWADPTTIEVLGALIDRAEKLPLLTLITYRPEFSPAWLSRSHVTPIALTRLSRAQGASIVLRVAGDKPLPVDLVAQIVDKTDGVPLFLEELTKAVLESDMLADLGDRYDYSGKVNKLAIPATLRDSLMARLDRLIPVKEIAQIGACLGREFSHELVQAVSPMGQAQLDEALDKLTASELVFRRGSPPEAVYIFKHALVQDAAYDSLLKSKRQALHAQIADAILERFPSKADTEPELLAHHYTEAGLTTAAIPYWQKAGELAQKRVALQEAIGHFERGLGLVHQLPPSRDRDTYELQLRALLSMAWLALQGWAYPAVAEHLEPAYALEEVLTPGQHSLRVLWGLWVHRLASGQTRQSLPMAEELLQQAHLRGDEEMRQAGLWGLVTTHYWLGQFEKSIEYADVIIDQYDLAGHRPLADALNHDPKTVALQYKAASLGQLGFADTAARLMHETLEHARARGHAFDHAWALYFAMAEFYAFQRDAAAIETLLAEFDPFVREQRLLVFEQMLGPYCGAIRDLLREKPENADQALRELTPGCEAARLGQVLCAMKTLRALAALLTRQPDLSLTLVDEVLAQIMEPSCGLDYLRAEVLRVKGLALQAKGDLDDAETSFRSAIELAHSQKAKRSELRASTSLARLCQSRGEYREAHKLLAAVYNWFTEGHDTRDLREAKALLEELA